MVAVDPNTPCVVGVGRRTWRPDEVGAGGAPEPLLMWEEVIDAARTDCGCGSDILGRVQSLDVVYCQTTQYDDPPGRLADALGIEPRRAHYSGIGGTTPQQLVNEVATRMLGGELDVALIVGAEALATKRRMKKAGTPPTYSYRPAEKPAFPWEAPFHPAEVAHEVFQAWLTFAVFDNARRAQQGTGLADYRRELGDLWAPFSEVAALNPEAWFPVARSVDELISPVADNRMVGYPYTKYMVSVMDVDMAAALVLMTHRAAEALNVAPEQRVYLRASTYAEDPVYLAEHDELWRSPAMAAAGHEVLADADVGIDDVAHFDLYSCFGSSVNFACDALGISPSDPRELTVTGGLPYHGGPASNYMSHSIATMVDVLRNDPGALGMVSGVGMHMTKHIFGLYSTEPGQPVRPKTVSAPQAVRSIAEVHEGDATVAAYTVVHGRDGGPEWGLAICDLPDGVRAYARFDDPDQVNHAETEELVGTKITLTPSGPVNMMRT